MPVTPITPAQIDEVGKGASASQTEPSQVEPLRVSPADAASVSSRGPAGLVSYLHRQWGWSKETFGPALRTKGIVQHITKELREIEADPHDLAEWVDVIILAMDGFWRHGGKPEDLLPAMQAKQDKNFARQWPDWRTMGEDQAIEHDRSGETRAPAFAAANPSGGWRPIDLAPKDASSVLLSDGLNVGEGFWHHAEGCHRADAGWFWEMDRGDLLTAKNAYVTHWQPLPSPPGALAGEARQGQDAQRLDPKDDHAASSEATPSIPPSPRKGQEENPCSMTVEEAREVLDGLDKRKKPAMHVLACRKASLRCSSSENADKLIAKADRIELALSTIRASEEDR